MSEQTESDKAWENYRNVTMQGWPRRQLRKREFLAGWDAALEARLPRVVDREELIGELRRLGMGGGLHEPLRQKVLEEWADHLIAFLNSNSPTRED